MEAAGSKKEKSICPTSGNREQTESRSANLSAIPVEPNNSYFMPLFAGENNPDMGLMTEAQLEKAINQLLDQLTTPVNAIAANSSAMPAKIISRFKTQPWHS